MSTEEQAIEKFLADIDPIEIARLMATIAPPQKSFSAAVLADAAIELQQAARDAVKRHKANLLEDISVRGLVCLRIQLTNEYKRKRVSQDEADQLVMISERLESLNTEGVETQNIQIELERESIEKELGPFPSQPWDLETALRYAIGDKKIEFSVLESAFTDLLKIGEAKDKLQIQAYNFEQLRKEIEWRKAILAKSTSAETKQELARFEKDLKSLTALKDYHDNFTPNKVAPDWLTLQATQNFERHWKNQNKIKQGSIIWIATHFREHWQKYKASYLEIHAAAKKATKAKAARSAKGATTRERNKWIKRTKSLITYLNEDNQRWESAKIPESLKGFIQQAGLKDPRTHEKILIFFGTLLNNLSAPPSSIKKQLKHTLAKDNPSGVGIIDKPPATYKVLSGVSDPTITDCLGLIKAAKSKL